MTDEEMKNKYSAFISEISEILGLGKPIDILKLCATTDLFFQPLEKRITELEKENAELRDYRLTTLAKQQTSMSKYALNLEHKLSWYDDQLTKAKELLKDITSSYGSTEVSEGQLCLIIKRAEDFLKENK